MFNHSTIIKKKGELMIGTHCDCKPKNTELVQEVKENMPAFDEIMNLSDFFKVMGDSTRLQLLLSLQQSEMCVSDLANVLDMTKSAVSHQLKALRLSKLIKSRKEGKTVYYSLDDEHIETILGMAFDHTKEH
ncbi:transcriptional regulator, ArsR family [Holdemanella biformis DSM 3989]|uniref:Transcriptional regulator, ArsR family n=5 Tax=Holdemanella TaxID=1573535 RepID=B7CCD6_9FIRM|nr:transcriptional regulator, ArsR family [Holdemanella biformis DSM 3989]